MVRRELFCFSCDNCVLGLYDECENTAKVGSDVRVEMKRDFVLTNEDEHVDETQQPIKSLVSVDQVIAVIADDANHDYYLLKVKQDLRVLDTETTDAWGATLSSGIEVFSGLYYNPFPSNPLRYRLILIKIKTAIVPANSLIYVFTELRGLKHYRFQRKYIKT